MSKLAGLLGKVAQVFDGDVDKTARWFRAKNPMLGDVSPLDMVRLGRFDRLELFVKRAASIPRHGIE